MHNIISLADVSLRLGVATMPSNLVKNLKGRGIFFNVTIDSFDEFLEKEGTKLDTQRDGCDLYKVLYKSVTIIVHDENQLVSNGISAGLDGSYKLHIKTGKYDELLIHATKELKRARMSVKSTPADQRKSVFFQMTTGDMCLSIF